jgi:integrase
MTATRATTGGKMPHWCWRRDLAGFRGLSEKDRAGFLVPLEWFESFRMRYGLVAGREAARAFWAAEVIGQERNRERWQLEQWTAAIRWYLKWLESCEQAGADHRSLPERLRWAVNAAGSRRGLALRTKQCYGAWAARFGVFAGEARKAMLVETATRFLTSVVDDEDCAYSTQKQALNALAFFFKHVCGVEDPVFGVRLRKTEARVPVVMSKEETQKVFVKLDEEKGCYGLAARLQYGAGLRLSELVRMRIKDVDLGRGTVTVRGGKGDKDRVSVLPKSLKEELAAQVERARELWRKDREAGMAGVWIPGALGWKFHRAAESFEWFWLFPARQVSVFRWSVSGVSDVGELWMVEFGESRCFCGGMGSMPWQKRRVAPQSKGGQVVPATGCGIFFIIREMNRRWTQMDVNFQRLAESGWSIRRVRRMSSQFIHHLRLSASICGSIFQWWVMNSQLLLAFPCGGAVNRELRTVEWVGGG